tara:strand:+ start:4115 stop:4654 length:540 start_codon:yes stop_codon:yes gene_type:complete
MATTLEIIQGINQAAANAYDGAHDDSLAHDGTARKVGLNREEGHIINDRRVVDGFRVRISGPILTILYQSETRLKDVAAKGFENDIASMINKIATFLKKEYKKITSDTITLTKQGDPSILVQKISNYRTDVRATCDYKVGGLSDVEEIKQGSSPKNEREAIRNFLALSTKKRPSNDKRS